MTPDLSRRVRAAIEETMRIARAVEPLGYTVDMGGVRHDEKFSHARRRFAAEDGSPTQLSDAAAERHFALHGPSDVLRACVADLRTLDRHQPELIKTRSWCKHCERLWPCVEFLDRAAAYGVPVEEST